MTIEQLRKKNLIILECISGSKAYGLDTETSDTDIKGVFILPKNEYYGLNYIPQISNDTNDIIFYEFGRFMELLSVNNPNILELLNTPSHAIIYKHPYLDGINSDMVLSKLCEKSFGQFALSQIKKAKGLKKKIVNPVRKDRKNILSFCYINYEQGSIPISKFFEIKKWKQENCGLIKVANMKDIYGLYYSNDNHFFNGIIRSESANDICLSSIPKGLQQECILYFNREGYSLYCKEYKEYWEWVENRNEDRYTNTQNHGKGYDAKNMMHVFRLLDMACEIGKDNKINVHRRNREFLLEIKAGKYEYEELLQMAEQKQHEMEQAFKHSSLPMTPNMELINQMTYNIRDRFYNSRE